MSQTTGPVPQDLVQTIVDPLAYGQRPRVEEAFGWLRANQPVARIEAEGFRPFWVLTRYADVLDAGKRNAEFLSGELPVILCDLETEEQSAATRQSIRTLVNMDGPEHLRYRAVTQSWFMPKNLREREDRIRAAARKSIDHLLAKGPKCDIVANLSSTYPLHIIMDILGVPEEHEERMLEWAKQLIAEQDPDMRRKLADDPQGHAAHAAVMGDLIQYFMAMAYDRRANPRDDVASIIANGSVNGAPLGDPDTLGYYIIIATAGHDTTAASTGTAIWQLAQNPELFARIKADHALIPNLVEESIRYITPVQHFMRTTGSDVEIGGQFIPKGEWVMLSYLSGNRDEVVFERPQEFDIDRSPNRHLAFGYGAHLCLGQHLAKLEMRILLEEFISRIDQIELTAEPKLVASTFVSGPKILSAQFKIA